MAKKKALSPRRRRYARARARGKTQAAAAIAAGYSPTRASVTGSEIERDPAVRAEIAALVEKVMPLEEVLQRLADQARSSISDVATIVLSPATSKSPAQEWVSIDVAKAIRAGKGHLIREMVQTEYGPKVKLPDSQTALVTFLKAHGALRERHEHTGRDGAPIEVTKIESVIVDPAAEGAS